MMGCGGFTPGGFTTSPGGCAISPGGCTTTPMIGFGCTGTPMIGCGFTTTPMIGCGFSTMTPIGSLADALGASAATLMAATASAKIEERVDMGSLLAG